MQGSGMRSFFIIDDDSTFCSLITAVLTDLQGMESLGESYSGADGLKACIEKKPDLVVVDIRLPEVNGLEILHLLQRQLPTATTVVASGLINPETVGLAIHGGASAIIEKGMDLSEMNDAFKRVINGERYFSTRAWAFVPENLKNAMRVG